MSVAGGVVSSAGRVGGWVGRSLCRWVASKSELGSEKLVVFVVSTTGQGEPPDNMKVRCVMARVRRHPTTPPLTVRVALRRVWGTEILGDASPQVSSSRRAEWGGVYCVWVGR